MTKKQQAMLQALKATTKLRTRIHGKTVFVVPGKTAATFAGGEHGSGEKGIYHFWQAVCVQGRGFRTITGRARKHLPPGERFTRIFKEQASAKDAATRKQYAKLAKTLTNAIYVRPANVAGVAEWLTSHASDAKHVKRLTF